MDVVYKTENSDIATVFIGDFGNNKFAEFVESVQPPIPVEKKWVLIVSTLFGCPVGCRMCDAGKFYGGKLSAEEIFSQIDYPVLKRFPDRRIFVEKFKIQFARMGEPALNSSVLEVLREFGDRYDAPGFIPSISTIAPAGTESFFDELTDIKNNLYGSGNFQMQFSIHTTLMEERDNLIPVKKWGIPKISSFGERFYSAGDRKITLNFVFSGELEINSRVLSDNFDTGKFLIKITPVNPTISAVLNGINTEFKKVKHKLDRTVSELREEGFDTLVSIGELEENRIGSNCGQYIGSFMKTENITCPEGAYTYGLEKVI